MMVPAPSGPWEGDSQLKLLFQLYSYTRPTTLPPRVKATQLQLKFRLWLCNHIEPKKLSYVQQVLRLCSGVAVL